MYLLNCSKYFNCSRCVHQNISLSKLRIFEVLAAILHIIFLSLSSVPSSFEQMPLPRRLEPEADAPVVMFECYPVGKRQQVSSITLATLYLSALNSYIKKCWTLQQGKDALSNSVSCESTCQLMLEICQYYKTIEKHMFSMLVAIVGISFKSLWPWMKKSFGRACNLNSC